MVIPEKYPKGMSAKIETEYKRNPLGTAVVDDKEKYQTDFKTMTCLTSNRGPVNVYRRPREGIAKDRSYMKLKFRIKAPIIVEVLVCLNLLNININQYVNFDVHFSISIP